MPNLWVLVTDAPSVPLLCSSELITLPSNAHSCIPRISACRERPRWRIRQTARGTATQHRLPASSAVRLLVTASSLQHINIWSVRPGCLVKAHWCSFNCTITGGPLRNFPLWQYPYCHLWLVISQPACSNAKNLPLLGQSLHISVAPPTPTIGKEGFEHPFSATFCCKLSFWGFVFVRAFALHPSKVLYDKCSMLFGALFIVQTRGARACSQKLVLILVCMFYDSGYALY